MILSILTHEACCHIWEGSYALEEVSAYGGVVWVGVRARDAL